MRDILLIIVACSSCGDARGSTCVRVDGILGHQQLRRSTDQLNHLHTADFLTHRVQSRFGS